MSTRNSITKAIEILKCLAIEPCEKTAIEISEITKINRTTVHRILNTLLNEMMILKNPTSKMYSIGPSAYHIGITYLNNDTLSLQVNNILDEIARKTAQSIGVAKLEGDSIINLYEIESYQPIKIGYKQGSYYPINCGAYGKTIMAFLDDDDKKSRIIGNATLIKKTENTIMDIDHLLDEYEKIRKRGYSISDGENVKGAFGVGVPIFDKEGKIYGAIASSNIKEMVKDEDVEFIVSELKGGAKKISKLLK